MKKTIYLLGLLMIFIQMVSCTKTFNSIEEYEKYIKGEDSPYRQEIIRNGVKLTLIYLPTDAVMIPEYKSFLEKEAAIKKNSSTSKEVKDSLLASMKEKIELKKNEYNNSIYFNLNISYLDRSRDLIYEKLKISKEEYSAWLQKLMFGLNEFIELKTSDGEEISKGIYHLERNYGMSPDRNILLLFNSDQINSKIQNGSVNSISVKISEFGLGIGSTKFRYSLPLKKTELNIEEIKKGYNKFKEKV